MEAACCCTIPRCCADSPRTNSSGCSRILPMAGTHRGDQPQRRVPQGSARPRPARRPRRAAARPPDQPGTGLPLRSRRPHGARLLVAGTPGRRLPHPFLGRRPRHPGSRQSGLAAPARPADPPRPARRRRRRLRAGAAAHGNPADLRLALYPQVQRIGDAPRAKPRPAGAKHARRPGRGDRTRRRLCRTGLQQGHAGAGEQPHHPARAHRVQRRRAAAPLPAALLAEQRIHPRTAGKLPAAVPPGSRRQPRAAASVPSPRSPARERQHLQRATLPRPADGNPRDARRYAADPRRLLHGLAVPGIAAVARVPAVRQRHRPAAGAGDRLRRAQRHLHRLAVGPFRAQAPDLLRHQPQRAFLRVAGLQRPAAVLRTGDLRGEHRVRPARIQLQGADRRPRRGSPLAGTGALLPVLPDQPRRRPRPADRPDSRRRRPGRHLPGHRAGLLLLRPAALAPAAPPRT